MTTRMPHGKAQQYWYGFLRLNLNMNTGYVQDTNRTLQKKFLYRLNIRTFERTIQKAHHNNVSALGRTFGCLKAFAHAISRTSGAHSSLGMAGKPSITATRPTCPSSSITLMREDGGCSL
jgi:hypothetical protein